MMTKTSCLPSPTRETQVEEVRYRRKGNRKRKRRLFLCSHSSPSSPIFILFPLYPLPQASAGSFSQRQSSCPQCQRGPRSEKDQHPRHPLWTASRRNPTTWYRHRPPKSQPLICTATFRARKPKIAWSVECCEPVCWPASAHENVVSFLDFFFVFYIFLSYPRPPGVP